MLKALDIKNTLLAILLYHAFFHFLLIIDLYILVTEVSAGTFNPGVEVVFPIGIRTNKAKTEIEIHPVTEEAKIRKCTI